MALVLAGDFGFGLNAEIPGASLGVGFGAHDNYGGNADVLEGLGGKDVGWSANAAFWGLSHSQSANDNSTPNNYRGVRSNIVTIAICLGVSYTHSQAASFKHSNNLNNFRYC